jgi:hypothetical protein
MNKRQVTERDIRLPQFRDAQLDDLEFDGTGEVARKDRFQTSMCKIQGMLHGVNGLSPRTSWTCEQVVEALSIKLRLIERLEKLICIDRFAPEDAEFYHFDNQCYVKKIDQDHLAIAKDEPSNSHLINFEFCETGEEWEASSGWLEYIDALVSIDVIREEIEIILRGECE